MADADAGNNPAARAPISLLVIPRLVRGIHWAVRAGRGKAATLRAAV